MAIAVGEAAKKIHGVARAGAAATVLGLMRLIESRRLRWAVALAALGGVAWAGVSHPPVVGIEPGEVAVRVNRLTGGVSEIKEGWALVLPGVHRLRTYSLRDQVYRPEASSRASGSSAFQSVEGLSLGVDLTVRYALDPTRITGAAQSLPEDVDHGLVQPMVDGVLHRIFAQHTVREIFSTQRQQIQDEIEAALKPMLAADGVLLRAVFVGSVDLPPEYKTGLEALLSEELATEKMRYTLELKEKQVKQTELEGEADKVKRMKAAEAAFEEEISSAKAKEEAMKHILPFKEKEIEERRLEAEANKVARIEDAQGNAEARRIEAAGEADSREKLAEADAYRMEVTGKAQSEQLARDSVLIAQNPLLIQKSLADKLSDKISVIIAPPTAGGFFAQGLLGAPATATAQKAPPAPADAQASSESPPVDPDDRN